MATISDVARTAGVSPASVSRVLNGANGVSDELAGRVRAAVAELGYAPFSAARALRRQTTDIWAIIVADVENPFFTSVVRGVEDAARERGIRVVLCNSDEDVSRESGYFDVAVAERMGGVIVAAASARQTDLTPLLQAKIPVVAIDRKPSGHQVDCVLVDNRRGAKDATAHLLAAGSERVACITGPTRVSTATERLAGYRVAIHDAGIVVDERLVAREEYRTTGGYEATTQLFARKPRPDALFVANNLMTVGALAALRDLGLRVPDDVCVVGFDDAPWATLIHPQLSVVAQPTASIGHTAADLLTTAAQADRPRRVVLDPTLIVRQSSVRL